MPKEETTTKFKVDISELKAGIQEANRQIRLANSEFKAATSGMDDWSKSADGVSAKLKQLNDVLAAEKQKLTSLEEQYALVVKEQGESSKGAEELRIKINSQKAAIGDTEKKIKEYSEKLADMKSSSDKAETASEKLTQSLVISSGFSIKTGTCAYVTDWITTRTGSCYVYQGFDDTWYEAVPYDI